MIIKYQGESLLLEVDVTDKLGADFNFVGATPIFSLSRVTTGGSLGGLVTKTPAVDGNKLTVLLTPLETSTMLGNHIWEIKVKDAYGNIDMISRDQITVVESNNPTFGTE